MFSVIPPLEERERRRLDTFMALKDNHHTTPPSFHALGAELASAVPPVLRGETDRDRAWRWVRVLGALGGHLGEAGREALAHEALSIDRERAANAHRVLSSL